MPSFNNVKGAYDFAEKQLVEFMKTKLTTFLHDSFTEFIDTGVYQTYEPTYYKRTYVLLNSVFVSEVTKKGNTYYISVYVPNVALGHYDFIGGYESEVTVSEVLWRLENDMSRRPETSVIEDYTTYLKNEANLIRMFMDFMKTKGIIIK